MIEIRAAEVRDAPRLVPLLRELGYEATPELLAEKLRILSSSAPDRVMVATSDAAVIGCVGCHVFELLHAPGRIGRITTLVVSATHRRRGVGAGLIGAADAFFRSTGCVRVEVTSGAHRADAHAFYTSAGFAEHRKRFLKVP
jgi:N-acetylglutamate synthase-like GNAT family acetyltransferase